MADQPRAENTLTEQPTIFDLIAALRREVGLFDGAMPITPQQAWEEALDRVRDMRRRLAPRFHAECGCGWRSPDCSTSAELDTAVHYHEEVHRG